KSEGDSIFAGVAGAFDQGVAAPAPDFIGREFFVNDGPEVFGDVVGRQLRVAGHAPPGKKNAKGRRAKIGGHADQFAQVGDLRFAHFGNRAGKIVVGGDGVDFDA